MKVAVLLFGHLRNFEECAQSLRDNLLDPYCADVFIHTWDVTDHNTMNKKTGSRTAERQVDDQIKQKITELYHPKGLVVEHQEPYKNAEVIHASTYDFSTASVHYMFYTMDKANQLRKQHEENNHFDYDCVVVTRPDVRLINKIDLDKSLNQAEYIGLDVDKCRFFALNVQSSTSRVGLNINGTNDLLFFGKSTVIDTYISGNKGIDVDFIKGHCDITIPSIYTSKEISLGLLPIPIAYTLGYDWTFSAYNKNLRYQSHSWLDKALVKIACFITRPIFRLSVRYKWLNPYA